MGKHFCSPEVPALASAGTRGARGTVSASRVYVEAWSFKTTAAEQSIAALGPGNKRDEEDGDTCHRVSRVEHLVLRSAAA